MTKVFGIEIGGKKEEPNEVIENIDHRAETRNFRASAPSVNIIPPQVINSYEVASVRNKFLITGTALALGLGGLYAYGIYLDSQSNAELLQLQATTSALQTEAMELAPYGQFYSEVGAKRQSLGDVMNGEIDIEALYSAIYSMAEQNGVRLANVTVTTMSDTSPDDGSGVGQMTCPTPDPFGSQAGLGCITFDGTAGNRSAIDAFVNSLNQIPGFANAYVPSSASTETGSSVSGSVLFNEQFRTDAWVDYTMSLDTMLSNTTETNDPTPDAEGDFDTDNGTTDDTVNPDASLSDEELEVPTDNSTGN